MTKRRYTSEEIFEMQTQIFEDNRAERDKFDKIADWVSGKARRDARTEISEYGRSPDNPHVRFHYISIPMSQYDNATPWMIDGVNGPNACKPPVAGIYIHTQGWMVDADIPDVGQVKFYVCINTYDAHMGGY